MRLVDILSEDLVVPTVTSVDREGLLKEVVERIAHARPDVDQASALRVLVERERIGSTGVAMASPHGKLPNLRESAACFARSVPGVEFNSLD